jgi:hypothetical protein
LSGCGGTVDAIGASAWSLTDITYPTGAWGSIEYETDQVANSSVPYMYTLRGTATPASLTTSYDFSTTERQRQGGPRVKKIERYSGTFDDSIVSAYTYGPGYSSGVPSGWWPNLIGSNDGLRLYAPSNRGKVGVYYAWVKETDQSDGSYTTTHYTVSEQGDYSSSVDPIETVVYYDTFTASTDGTAFCSQFGSYNTCADLAIVQGNQDWNWGQAHKVDEYDATTRGTPWPAPAGSASWRRFGGTASAAPMRSPPISDATSSPRSSSRWTGPRRLRTTSSIRARTSSRRSREAETATRFTRREPSRSTSIPGC